MTLEIKDSANYAAQIVTIPELHKLPNSDKLYGLNVFGFTAIVDESWVALQGQLAVVFAAESQLAHEYVYSNNLYRHEELNYNPTSKGYLEDSRRVKAMKLRGNVSKALAMPVGSLLGVQGVTARTIADLKPGDQFDTLDGVQIVRKYRLKEPQAALDRHGKQLKQAFKRLDSTMLPEHFDTDQWLKNEHVVDDNATIVVTQKLHGTSARFANTIVKRELKWWERALVKLGVTISDTGYDTVAGSRRSIKDPHNPAQQHFYNGKDIWTDYLPQIEHAIPKGFIVYGEIVGWVRDGGTAIQAGHTYGYRTGENELFVYRVAFINPDGLLVDLSWDQVRVFCESRGIRYTPELWRGAKKDFLLGDYVERDFHADYLNDVKNTGDSAYPDEPVPLSAGGTGKDEGIVIRVDSGALNPLAFKYKNDSHYLYETKQLDTGVEDIEAAES